MNVLVAVEPGKRSEELLAAARVLAHAGGWDVRIVHVRASDDAPALRLPTRLLTSTEVRERLGDAAPEILAESTADDVELLAFGLGGGGAQEGVGRVADALLRAADRPLFVARPGVQHIGALKRILVPLAGSPSSSEAMRYTEEHLCARGREITVLHVATADLPHEPGSMGAPRMVDQEQYEWSDWHQEFSMRFAACSTGGRHRTVVKTGDPAGVIIDQANESGAELIVLAWKQELGEGRATAIKGLLENAPCPLLLVPAATALPL